MIDFFLRGLEDTAMKKLICISIFLSAPAHAMQGDKEPDKRLIATAKYTDKNENAQLITQTRYTTHQTHLGYQLARAAKRGHHKKLQELIASGAMVNHMNAKGETPLINAAIFGRHECLRTLIDAGASVHHVNDLMWKAASNGWPECICILARHAMPQEKNYALMTAVINNKQKCVQVLIDAGADVYHINMCYQKPILVLAAQKKHLPICKLLIQAMLLPKKQKDAVVAFVGSKGKGLLHEWKVPRDILVLIGKQVLTASKQANTLRAIHEIKNIEDAKIQPQLLKHIHQ